MRVRKAQRRWIAWCRYIQKTNSQADRSRRWGTDIHHGQEKAYQDVMYARRWSPIGVRNPWYPRWGNARWESAK